MSDDAKALVPLDVEAVARWLNENIYSEVAPIGAAKKAAAFVAHFGVPAPDAEALRLAEWCAASAEKARRFALGFTNRTREAFEADAATFDAIASRLRGEAK